MQLEMPKVLVIPGMYMKGLAFPPEPPAAILHCRNCSLWLKFGPNLGNAGPLSGATGLRSLGEASGFIEAWQDYGNKYLISQKRTSLWPAYVFLHMDTYMHRGPPPLCSRRGKIGFMQLSQRGGKDQNSQSTRSTW